MHIEGLEILLYYSEARKVLNYSKLGLLLKDQIYFSKIPIKQH